MCAPAGIPIQLKSQSRPRQNRKLSLLQGELRFADNILDQEVVHILVAVIQIAQRGTHLIARAGGNACLIQPVKTDIDTSRFRNRGGFPKSADASRLMQTEHDEIRRGVYRNSIAVISGYSCEGARLS